MKQRNAFMLGVVWILVTVSVIASTLTLMANGGFSRGMRFRNNAEIVQRYARLEDVRRILTEGYYQDVDEEALIEGAIRGMMNALKDPYTFYYSPEEMSKHAQETGAGYCGMGMLVQNNSDGFIEVIRVYANGPAAAAGIVGGDLILSINGNPVNGTDAQNLNEAVGRLGACSGEKVRVVVRRGEETLCFDITPGEVAVDNIAFSMVGDHIGYISIFQFSGNAVEGFRQALESLAQRGAKGLIVDVRNNPGGLLDDVVEIADELLGEGRIVYTEDRQGSRQEYDSDAAHCDLPMAILVNRMSASASEILAAALQEHGRALVIGEQTYGKGIVQTLVTFEEDGAGMQYTSACYYTPSGRSIQGTGVTPDLLVRAQAGFNSYSGIPDLENDLQLQAALVQLQGA